MYRLTEPIFPLQYGNEGRYSSASGHGRMDHEVDPFYRDDEAEEDEAGYARYGYGHKHTLVYLLSRGLINLHSTLGVCERMKGNRK